LSEVTCAPGLKVRVVDTAGEESDRASGAATARQRKA
jgi:hypothetical protein